MIAPKIRFPEFHDEYVNDSLSEISDRVRRKNSENQTDIPLTIASIEGLVDQRTYFGKAVASKDMSGYYLLQNGEFAYNKSYSKGFPVGSIKRLDKYAQGALSTLYICFALKDDADVTSDYLVQYFNSPAWYEAVYKVCAEGARNHGLLNVSPNDFFATTHHFAPTKEEQDKVATFLSLYDRKIENQMTKVEALETRRKGLLQQIFSHEIRFKTDDGGEFPDWESHAMGEFFTERKEKAQGGEELLSVTIANGVIRQADSDKRDNSSENKNNYKRVMTGDMAYNTMRMWQGAEGVSYWDGIVSPAYTIIVPEDGVNAEFFMVLFKTYEALKQFTIYSQGMSSDQWNLKFDIFADLKFDVPCSEEQAKIVTLFKLLDKQIQIEKDKLEAIKLVKKGLLQQMFV